MPACSGSRPRLTPRRRAVLGAIARLSAAHGYPPTLREVGEEVGIRHVAGVHEHVTALRRLGLVTSEEGRPRTLRVTQRPGAQRPGGAQLADAAPGSALLDRDGRVWLRTDAGAVAVLTDPDGRQRRVDWRAGELDAAQDGYGPFVEVPA